MLLCMRTTIDIDDALYRELKKEAAKRGMKFREVVHEHLRRARALRSKKSPYQFRWKTDPPGRIQPGVRLDDRDSLFDLMDGRS